MSNYDEVREAFRKVAEVALEVLQPSPPVQTKPRCDQCRFFRTKGDYPDVYVHKRPKGDTVIYGRCHARPPRFVNCGQSRASENYKQPAVQPGDWCGLFQPKEGES